MQELIEVLKNRVSSSKEIQSTAYPQVTHLLEEKIEELEMCIELAESMLEKEKEVIIKAAADHSYPTYGDAMMYAEQYYNETFNTKER